MKQPVAKKTPIAADQKLTLQNAPQFVSMLFKDDDGNPLQLAPTQARFFYAVAAKTHARILFAGPTQYGKSESLAPALVCRAALKGDGVTIVGATAAKSTIIMQKCIQHVFDNPLTQAQLQVDGKLDELRRQRNREYLTFRGGGHIRMLTAQSVVDSRKTQGKTLIGEGDRIIVIDDSHLMPNDVYAFILRMVGGRKDTLVVELGNCAVRNHFYRSMTRKVDERRVLRILIDYKRAIEEGRFTQEFIDDIRQDVSPEFFRMYYECRFPDEGDVSDDGYRDLLSWHEIEAAVNAGRIPNDEALLTQLKGLRWRHTSTGKIQMEPKEEMRVNGVDSPDRSDSVAVTFAGGTGALSPRMMGCDVAGGGNENVFVVRDHLTAKIVHADHERDTMKTVEKIMEVAKEHGIPAHSVYVDKTGLGHGIVDRLHQLKFRVVGIHDGATAEDSQYKNVRAEVHFRMRRWLTSVSSAAYASPVAAIRTTGDQSALAGEFNAGSFIPDGFNARDL